MDHQDLLSRLATTNESRIVLLVLDGVGDLRTSDQPQTALQKASTPNLDALAAAGSCGRIVPVEVGVTPGSGPGHLALFGYDPREPSVDIGRGVLEALGANVEMGPGDIAARGNFATAAEDGLLTDRRAGRIPSSECERLCSALQSELDRHDDLGAEVTVHAGEGHRFVLRLQGPGLSPGLADTDPQQVGHRPLPVTADDPAAEPTATIVRRIVELTEGVIRDEPNANRILLRGFSSLPHLPSLPSLHDFRCGAFAGYPLYRGVAAACGMERVECPKRIGGILEVVADHWNEFDFFFLHVKQTDQAGEDGDLDAKVRVLEEVDAVLPRLLELGPDVVAVTGDHSTPAPMAAHSWHPVPLLISGGNAFVDDVSRFDEAAVTTGHLGTFAARLLMGLLLAHAGRIAKFGA